MQQLKDNLPIISLGLLILGTVNMMLFYDFSNVNILSYLDFAEILQIQFRLFATAGALIVAFFAFAMFTYRDPVADHEMWMKKIDSETPEERTKNLSKAEWGYRRIKIFLLVFLLPTLTIYIVKVCLNFTDEDKRAMWVVSILVFAGLLILSYNQITSIEEQNTEDKESLKQKFANYRYMIGFIFLVYASGVWAWINAMSYVSLTSAYEVSVVME